MAKFGKGKTKLSPVGLVLEKHSNREGEEVYTQVYREHPLLGKIPERSPVSINNVLKKPWRWRCELSVVTDDGVVDTTEVEIKNPILAEDMDRTAEEEMIALCTRVEDSWVKICYKMKILGR